MSLNVNGLDELKLRLQRLKGVPLAANAELKILAEETAALARRMAPVDKEKLEEAIKVRFEGTERNALGRFVTGGGAYTVFVDNSVPVEGRKDKTVGDYAWEMHEHLTPAGPMSLGRYLSRSRPARMLLWVVSFLNALVKKCATRFR
jgi:hypothetical protein